MKVFDCYDPDVDLSHHIKRYKPRWRQHLLEQQNGACYWCRQTMRFDTEYQNTVTIEHVTPQSEGGSGHRWNIVGACLRCNSLRSSQSAELFELTARRLQPDNRSREDALREIKRAARQRRRQRERGVKTVTLLDRVQLILGSWSHVIPA